VAISIAGLLELALRTTAPVAFSPRPLRNNKRLVDERSRLQPHAGFQFFFVAPAQAVSGAIFE